MQQVMQEIAQQVSAKFDEHIDRWLLSLGINDANRNEYYIEQEQTDTGLKYTARKFGPVLGETTLPKIRIEFDGDDEPETISPDAETPEAVDVQDEVADDEQK